MTTSTRRELRFCPVMALVTFLQDMLFRLRVHVIELRNRNKSRYNDTTMP
jgi:hypothetical protein